MYVLIVVWNLDEFEYGQKLYIGVSLATDLELGIFIKDYFEYLYKRLL